MSADHARAVQQLAIPPTATVTVTQSIHGPNPGYWIDIQLDETTLRQQHTPSTIDRATELADWLRTKLSAT